MSTSWNSPLDILPRIGSFAQAETPPFIPYVTA
jgi:hypothetical protein